MSRFVWLSDIHLNFTWEADEDRFDQEYYDLIEEILSTKANGVLLGGDIAEAPELLRYLGLLESDLSGLPIYFVLGNHDFYRSSVREVRSLVAEYASQSKTFTYLTAAEAPLALTSETGLIGHDGFADGRFGELEWSHAKISDLSYIQELVEAGEEGRRKILNFLGDEAAAHLKTLLEAAVRQFPSVVLLTHVPPWLPLAIHNGRECDYEYAPYFASKAIGETIEAVMNESPACRLTVLCGHTHCAATYEPLPNISAVAAKAEYGTPRIQQVLEF